MNQETITRILLVSGAAAGTGYGSWYLYEFNQPKNYKDLVSWLGHKIATEDDAYKAIFVEYQDKGLKDINELKEVTSVDHHKKIKEWCEKHFKNSASKSDRDSDLTQKLSKYCTDNPKTVKGKLQRQGKSGWIEDDKDYKVLVVLYRDNEELKTLTGIGASETTGSNEVDANYEKLKDFCEKGLKKPLDGSFNRVSGQIFKWCRPYNEKGKTKVEDILKKEDSSWNKESNGNFSKTFGRWKYTPSFIEVLKKENGSEDLSSDTQDSDGAPKLQTWCTKNLVKDIWEENIYFDKYFLIKSVCKKFED